MNPFLFFISLGISCVTAIAALADTLTEKEVIAAVLRNNPSIKSARANWEAMKQRVPQARAWDDTMAEVAFEGVGSTMMDNASGVEWMLSQSLPVSGKNLSRSRAADAEARVEFEMLRRIELEKVNQARMAFFRLANGFLQMEINDKNRELTHQFAEISRVKYEAGLKTESDIFLAQTEEARLDETEANIRRDISDQQTLLNVLMNRSADASIKVKPIEFHETSFSHEKIEREALSLRPEILVANHRMDAGNAKLQLARREWIPDPQLWVKIHNYHNQNPPNQYDTGILFSIPWINYHKYAAGINETRSGFERAQQDRETARIEALGMARNQLRKIDTFARNYVLFRDKVVPLARKTVEASRASYESDKIGFIELISARRDLQNAESTMTEHLMNHEIAVAELDSLIGREPAGHDSGGGAQFDLNKRRDAAPTLSKTLK